MNHYLKYLVLLNVIFSQNEVCFEIEPNPNQSQPGFGYFSKYINVLDCFENKVNAIGSKERPIIFKKHNEAKKWGTVAIHGLKAEGSLFKNIIIENASGKSINGIYYFASLSVHSTKNIKFDKGKTGIFFGSFVWLFIN